MSKSEKSATHIALFQERRVRRVWHHEQWFFSVIDVIEILTDSSRPRKYWDDLKRKLREEGRDYAIRTNEIAQATFGMGIQEHKAYKELQKSHNCWKSQKPRDRIYVTF